LGNQPGLTTSTIFFKGSSETLLTFHGILS